MNQNDRQGAINSTTEPSAPHSILNQLRATVLN